MADICGPKIGESNFSIFGSLRRRNSLDTNEAARLPVPEHRVETAFGEKLVMRTDLCDASRLHHNNAIHAGDG